MFQFSTIQNEKYLKPAEHFHSLFKALCCRPGLLGDRYIHFLNRVYGPEGAVLSDIWFVCVCVCVFGIQCDIQSE